MAGGKPNKAGLLAPGVWLALARAPFHIVGTLPFLLGVAMARAHGAPFRLGVCLWGVLGVELVMLATYLGGEYWDYDEDTISGQLGGSRFAGGSQVPQRGLVARRVPLIASFVSVGLALAVGLLLHLRYRTGPLTLPLGLLGILGGFFYSAPPLRWVSTGWGEGWIALCYGWLPVATGYYLQTGELHDAVWWVSLPIGLTIFNVILLNEFPDHPADRATGKRNLAVRLGLKGAAGLYCAVALCTWPLAAMAVRLGAPDARYWLCAPALLSFALVVAARRNIWQDRRVLELMCAGTIAVNVGTTAAYLIGFVRR